MSARDVVDRFLDCATDRPDHPAIVVEDSITSYGALERRARAFACVFSRFAEPRVLIGLRQSVDAYAAILGAGLAGGYHTPLNASAPLEKLRRIASRLDPDIIVADAVLAARLGAAAPRAGLLDPKNLAVNDTFAGCGRRHRLAYVIFTSGSTGVPKGVVVPRSALAHYVQWMTDAFEVVPEDRFSQHPNLGFDISMTDLFGALCHGATLCPLAREVDRLMPARMIARERVTVWNSVPSVVNLMMRAEQVTAANLASVRLFNFCGEPLLPMQLEALFAARPDVLARNTYGPTEATVAVTDLPLRASNFRAVSGASVSIGPPIPGMGLHLVGGPSADEGQIVLTGPQLADGYWNDPAQTAEVFRDVEIDGRIVRGYYTGDWAERRAGSIFFKERMDFQVKIKGFRVELDEVTAAIHECGYPVACVFKRGEDLAAVVERVPGLAFNAEGLRLELACKVEAHAVPAGIRLIDRMPRNENDKLDRQAAAAWYDARQEEIR